MAETQAAAEVAFAAFVECYALKYEKAADCLAKDCDALLAFRCLSNKTALAIVFKLVEGAQRSWRRLDGHNQSPKLILS